jgi:hypothetical protein
VIGAWETISPLLPEQRMGSNRGCGFKPRVVGVFPIQLMFPGPKLEGAEASHHLAHSAEVGSLL